jgi:hypothetical protein
MGNVVPFERRPGRRIQDTTPHSGEQKDYYTQGTVLLHETFDRLAQLEGFALGLPKQHLINTAHHAVNLQDEVNSLVGYKDDPSSEAALRLAEMAAQLETLALADYISTLGVADAHRTPQRVMAYTGVYIDRLPLLLQP